MKRVFAVLFAALVVTSSAIAADDASRQGLGIPGGNVPGSPPPDGPADVLIASSTNGGVFTNLAPNYQAAFTAAGAASVTSSLILRRAPSRSRCRSRRMSSGRSPSSPMTTGTVHQAAPRSQLLAAG